MFLRIALFEIRFWLRSWMVWIFLFLIALLIFGAIQMNWLSPDLLEEIDNPLDETTSLSFRSESQKLTVVWIGDRSTSTSAEDEPDPGEETIQ